jgi:DNA-binding IclR family transcriptional regulator
MRRRTVKSASRAFEVLELFAELRRPLRLNEIHTALGYPQSSTTTLLKSMVMSGYLNYSRHSRTYLPTTQVSALGNWLTGHIVADPAYRTLVERLQRITNETVGLATENDLYIQYVLFREPSHEFKSVPREGVMRPMIDSAAGLALLSQMSDRQIEKIFRYSHYYRMNDGEAHRLEGLMQDIRWIRQIGYAHHETRPRPLGDRDAARPDDVRRPVGDRRRRLGRSDRESQNRHRQGSARGSRRLSLRQRPCFQQTRRA